MSGERYRLWTPSGVQELPGSLRPDTLRPLKRQPRLVRAYGYRDVYDLSDRLGVPTSLVLTGDVKADSEAELSILLYELEQWHLAATHYDRDERNKTALLWATLTATPYEDNGSQRARIVSELMPAQVPTTADGYYW